MTSVYNYTLRELEDFFISIDEKKYRAHQLYDFLYHQKITTFSEVTTFSYDLINKINDYLTIDRLKIIDKQETIDTVKYLFELNDGHKIETVLMRHNYGNSICISTQVGCNMGCLFCESGRLKKVRDLEPAEMVLQILMIQRELNEHITHVVIMGIGEPFDNYDNVIKFIKIINDNKGLNIGARRITVSTCGLISQIEAFMNEPFQVNLAISLHSAIDNVRSKLMPVNKVYNISKIIEIIKQYIKKTNRRVTFEYIMLYDINDSEDDALALVKLLKGINCYVNLIPYNETSNLDYKKSSKERILVFYDILKKNKINVTIRREFGTTINAACGQLRSKY
ncbi:MAG: 23S rRNA (adenine(2503)-C(2))-methyltransferase RlmN [Bacilli bacterium]|jgi:23S rRNA (adenine2503-C2)-methyltransferase